MTDKEITKPLVLTDVQLRDIWKVMYLQNRAGEPELGLKEVARNIAEAQRDADFTDMIKQFVDYLEKYVFYVDTRGFIALKPNATKNYQALQKVGEK